MAKMPPHEFLINTMLSTVLNIVPFPSSPIAPSGILANEFGYALNLPEFEETIRELMKKKGAKVPDLLLVNTKKKLLVTVECKSDFTFEIEERLTKQIEFYSSKIYRKMCREMFSDLINQELWIFSPEDFCPKISKLVSKQVTRNLVNIVIWGVKLRKKGEEALIQKFYGDHLDSELNQKMDEGGLTCSPPRFELLIDPTLSYGKRVFRIGRRILTFLASLYVSEKDRIVSLQSFKEKHKDVIMTDRELKKCMRYLSTLVPEIGEYNSKTGEIILAKRPSLDKIKAKLLKIQEMNDEEIKVELARIRKVGVRGIKHPRGPQKTKLSKWLPEKNVTQGFMPWGNLDLVEEDVILTVPWGTWQMAVNGKKEADEQVVIIPRAHCP